MADRIQVVQVGLGALGRLLAAVLAERSRLEVVAAVDADPALLGRDLGDIAGLARRLGISVTEGIRASFIGSPAVAVHTTVSSLESAVPQIGDLLARGLNVISSCEELIYPWKAAPEISAELDARARAAGLSVLGTGVNPGYLMDFLPTALTAVCREVRKVTVLRYQDARSRRLPFQQKIGAGLTPQQFARKRKEGALGHVGLTESIHLIAARLGWSVDTVEESVEPLLAQRQVSSDHIRVRPGEVAGLRQLGIGRVDGEERIRLEFRASLGEEDVQDTVLIDGIPSLRFTIPAGIHGDLATCALLTNAVPVVVAAAPGLRTMADMPPVSWFSG